MNDSANDANQDFILALQELNVLLDEEAHQSFDPDNKELWERVEQRIDGMATTLPAEAQRELREKTAAINPSYGARGPIDALAPRELAKAGLAGLSDTITEAVAEKLAEFGFPALNTEQKLKLTARIHSVLQQSGSKPAAR